VKTYYMVDIWAAQKHYDDRANVANEKQQRLYEAAVKATNPYRDRTDIHVMKMYSLEAAGNLSLRHTNPVSRVLEPFLDVVYLDARHDYCGYSKPFPSLFSIVIVFVVSQQGVWKTYLLGGPFLKRTVSLVVTISSGSTIRNGTCAQMAPSFLAVYVPQ
jgi:hypothetical protein